MKILLASLACVSSAFASASLTLGTPIVAADGITLTAPIGGCSSPLSPSVSILGFSAVYATAAPITINSVKSSGCNVIITLAVPIPRTGGTFTGGNALISLATTTGAGFLTDAMGNTPQSGQSFIPADPTLSEWRYMSDSSILAVARVATYHLDSSSYANAVVLGNAVTAQGMSDSCYGITATATAFDLFAFEDGNDWVIRRDSVTGTLAHDWGINNTNAYGIQGLVTGLSGTHEYNFCQNNPQNGGYPVVLMVRVTGTLGAQPAAKPLIAAAGDSLRKYAGPEALTDGSLGDMFQVASAVNAADVLFGIAGATISSLVTEIPAALTFTGVSFPLAFLAWSSGGNDISDGASPSDLANTWDTLLTNMDALSNPPTHIVVEGLPPEVTPYSLTYDAAIAAVVANHPRACFVSTVAVTNVPAWINSVTNAAAPTTGDRQTDAIHIIGSTSGSIYGYAKVANREIPIAAGFLNGASYVFTGPTTGQAGVPSTFTVGAVTSSTFAGETITPSDFGDGGTFTPASLTLTDQTTSATFTYNAASAGVKTINLTGLPGCYTAPASIAFTASAASGGTFIGTNTYFGRNVGIR